MRATEAAVSAVKVAAPSSTLRCVECRAAQLRKSLRSSDFGGGLREERMREQPRDRFLVDNAGPRHAAVGIERLAGAQPHEVIEQRVAGSGIAGNQIVAVDIGHVGDAADIEHRDRRARARAARTSAR